MTFAKVKGQPAAIATLERALRSGTIHHAYRFEGPNGVGKEAAAFAFAQALVCKTPPPAGHQFHACGTCSACAHAVTFASEPPEVPLHPDVVVIERGLYPAEVLRRSRPELQDISVDQIRRLVLERMSFSPHDARGRIFIVRRAHELSISAANALLKTLEEPPADTYFVLLTDRPSELLPTIHSRTLPIRFAPLPDALLRSILEERGVAPDAAQGAAELAAGSAALAIELCDAEATQERRAFVEAAVTAARSGDLSAAVALSEARARDKDVLHARLTSLSAYLARVARTVIEREPARAGRAARGYEVVTRAMLELESNGSPALVLESMVARLRHEI
ncbi:MAG TPA: DNA polymerase III subunit [Polyangiaceae bacterium]|jgi:DNA polymerase-3 subunit delta'